MPIIPLTTAMAYSRFELALLAFINWLSLIVVSFARQTAITAEGLLRRPHHAARAQHARQRCQRRDSTCR
eukprot:1514055-Pleurochrysis_carterae.AAC.1